MTACAFELFKRNTSDWSLIEVGMGGSYDATNSIPNKDLSIITPISLDHEIFLGDTIKKIAIEKLGIINHKSTVVFSRDCRLTTSFTRPQSKACLAS